MCIRKRSGVWKRKILQIIDLSFMPWRVPLFLHRYLSDLVKLSCKQKVLQICFSKVTLVLFHHSEEPKSMTFQYTCTLIHVPFTFCKHWRCCSYYAQSQSASEFL